MALAAWMLVLFLFIWLFQEILDRQRNPNPQVASRVSEAGVREIELLRNRFGHYVASGRINGRTVELLVDTGATTISVPASLAGELGLERGPGQPVTTANGTVTVFQTRLARVELGDISLSDVRAHINPHMDGPAVLLGMSFLSDLEFVQRGSTLIIRQYP